MSFKEKSAAVTLAVLVFVYGGYFLKVANADAAPSLEMIDRELVGTVVGLVVLLILAHVALGVANRMAGGDESEDERDRLIEVMAERNGGLAVSACAIGGIVMILMGGEWPGGLAPVAVIHAALGALVLGEIIKRVSQIVYYRRGV